MSHTQDRRRFTNRKSDSRKPTFVQAVRIDGFFVIEEPQSVPGTEQTWNLRLSLKWVG